MLMKYTFLSIISNVNKYGVIYMYICLFNGSYIFIQYWSCIKEINTNQHSYFVVLCVKWKFQT